MVHTVETFAAAHGITLPPDFPRDLLWVPVEVSARLKRTLGETRGRYSRFHDLAGLPNRGVQVLGVRIAQRVLAVRPVLEETFRHELAHAWAMIAAGPRAFGREAHGPVWMSYAARMGARPISCAGHDMVAQLGPDGSRVVARCDACGYELKRHRALKAGKVFRHLRCGGTMVRVG